MFKRLGAAFDAVKNTGAVEAITRGPNGFLQVMAFLWFSASILVLWFPPGILADGTSQSREIFGPSGLSVAFMVCSVLHVVLLVFVRVRGPAPALDSDGQLDTEPKQLSQSPQDD